MVVLLMNPSRGPNGWIAKQSEQGCADVVQPELGVGAPAVVNPVRSSDRSVVERCLIGERCGWYLGDKLPVMSDSEGVPRFHFAD